MSKNCEVCNKESKYVCPRCGCRTCSLECFKKHKVEKSCSGQSETTAGTRDEYIGKRALDEKDVQRDYNFLLRMDRNLALAKRQKGKVGGGSSSSGYGGRDWIVQRGVRVRKVPVGMSRGRENKSGKKGKGKEWFWSVEFIRVSDGERCMKYRCNEKSKISECLPEGWECKGIWVKDCENGCVRVLSGDMKLCDALHGLAVIEFPTIYIGEVNGKEGGEEEEEVDEAPEETRI